MTSVGWFPLRLALGLFITVSPVMAQIVTVGAGSYTTALPAGSTPPQPTVYKTAPGPALTHKFWTSKYWNPLGTTSNGGPVYMFPQPLSMQTNASGLTLGYFNGVNNNGTWFNQPFQNDLTVGVAGLNSSVVEVSASHDWSVDFSWGSLLTATAGRGFPFVYFKTNGPSPTVTFSGPPTIFSNNANVLGVSIGGNNYGLFCPAGGTWSGIGGLTLTCNHPNGHNYFSLALLPSQAALSTYAGYAFSFPTDTQVSWSYNPTTSAVSTTYAVTTQAMEGTQTGFLMALYPHQYTSLAGGANTAYSYISDRGKMNVNSGTSFTTTDTYHGTLPFLPPASGYSAATLKGLIDNIAAETDHFSGNDTYGLGKQFSRIAQLMPLAKTVNDTNALNNFKSTLEAKMQTWFTAGGGKTSDLFYLDPNWNSYIGYPASYGSNDSLNDHHFHYGYWMHAAGMVGLFDPTWLASSNWGGMVDMMRQDVANSDRSNPKFPFMRHFDVYAGHSWASGQAPFGDGGNEESSSEAVNAWTGLILYGVASGNTQARDAGIWLYTMETNAVQDYWFNDGPVATFPVGFNHTTIANLFDAKSDTGTWFGGQPDFEHGIEFLPFTGGSLYLGRDPAYVQRNYNELYAANGNSVGPDWPDLMEEFEALVNPADAINQWNTTAFTFDGETRAHEYYWLQELLTLGHVDYTVTANTPLYAVFKNPANGVRTHAAYNAQTAAVTVAFSDGFNLSVPAGSISSEYGAVTLGGGTNNPTPPLAPSSLTGSAASATQVNLSWQASSTAGVTYDVYRSTVSGFAPSASTLRPSGGSGTTFADSGLTVNTTYYYVVRAANAAGESPSSNQATVTTQAVTIAAPSSLTATTISSSQINLSWVASSTAGVTYNVYRGTASGFTTSASNRIAASVSGTAYSNTGLAAATTYFYLVRATNGTGESPSSNQASITTAAGGGTTGAPVYIDAGGGTTGSWIADTDFAGGTTLNVGTGRVIDTSLISAPVPPQAVYQTERYGNMTYTFRGLTPGRNYTVQLHFAETHWTTQNARKFNVLINTAQVLTNFDVLANAGAPNKAIEENFGKAADANGVITVQFTTGSADVPEVKAIAVF